MKNHQNHWNYLQKAYTQKRMPQAMLFAGQIHAILENLVQPLSQLLLCQLRKDVACGVCADCLMVARSEHPDIQWIKAEKKNGPIKIDQIRQLQQDAYLTPQRASYRVILIEDADKMNMAAANALLKILEEPSEHTIFVLLAQQLSTILPTVLSRCQLFSCTIPYTISDLLIGSNIEDEDKNLVIQNAQSILAGMIAVIEGQESACTLALSWLKFELHALLWFIYLVFAQLLEAAYIPTKVQDNPQLIKLHSLLRPETLCKQLDKIITLSKKLSHNINSNHTLSLEDFLLSM